MASLAVGSGAGSEGEAPSSVEINGKSYKPLADGKYDVIVLGTGMKECVLAGLLAVSGKRVLQLDRNGYYGADCASLDLEALHKHFKKPYDEAKCKDILGSIQSGGTSFEDAARQHSTCPSGKPSSTRCALSR